MEANMMDNTREHAPGAIVQVRGTLDSLGKKVKFNGHLATVMHKQGSRYVVRFYQDDGHQHSFPAARLYHCNGDEEPEVNDKDGDLEESKGTKVDDKNDNSLHMEPIEKRAHETNEPVSHLDMAASSSLEQQGTTTITNEKDDDDDSLDWGVVVMGRATTKRLQEEEDKSTTNDNASDFTKGTVLKVQGMTTKTGREFNDTLCTVVCKVSDRYMVRFHKDGQHRYVPVSRLNSWSLASSTQPDSLQSWSCSACTLLHKGDRATAAKCDACESPRRAEVAPAVARPRKKQPAVTSILAQAMAIPRKKIIARPPAPPPNKPKAPRKKNYNHPCIHGARCDYIRSGRDNCDFFHTAAEIELAAAKLAAAKLAAAKTTVERVVPIPAAIVSFIIGKSGAHVQKMSSKSGALIFVEVNTKSPDNFHNVRIQGNREQVEEGEKLVKEMVARFHPSRGSGPSEGASTNDNNSSIASGASSTQMPQVLVPHPTQMQLATQRTTALMADQAKTVASATSSVRVTGTFLPHPSQLHPAAKQTTVSYSSIASIPSVPTPREPDPVVTAPRASKRSSFEPAISRPTVAKSSLALTSKKQHSFDPTISKSRVVTPTSVMEHSSFHTAQAMRASEPKVVGPTLASSSAVALLAFLREHADCFKGSPEAFCEWLVGTEDICSLCDLADAASDNDYLRDVLQQGDGMSVGVKGFKRAAFQKAAMAARNNAKTTSNSADNDEPPAELMCPISHVLMTQDPVIAADGYTYERHAIEAWFQKQQLQVATARGQIAAGLNSHQAHAIIERGVLSPMTHTKLPHLLVLPNTAVRTMARDVAAKHAAESTNASDVFGACLLA